MRLLHSLAALCLALVIAVDSSASEDWARFRGPAGSGISNGGIPAELNPERDLLWKIESGKGASSPVVVGSRVFSESLFAEQI